ncbi:MAG: hypothetical protein ACJAZO_002566 [Myxococcota bacterium]|jgi:hypothetical protein
MSYFDHVRCPSCKAHIDPEKVEVLEGVAVCPSCKAQIGITDMFGLKAAFDEDDDDTMSIDDLVGSGPGGGNSTRTRRAYDPTASVAPAPPRKPRQLLGPGGVLSALADLKKNR